MFDREAMTRELVRDEKLEPQVYDDATGKPITKGSTLIGYPTIGIGRRLDWPGGLSSAESYALADNDLNRYERELSPRPWFVGLDDIRQRAVVNMRHQLGLQGLLDFHDMIAAIERKDYIAAAAAGRASLWFKETPARAGRCMNIMQYGVAPAVDATEEA
jgi:lysozyme